MGEDERVKKTLKVNRNLINALIEQSCCFLFLSLSSFFQNGRYRVPAGKEAFELIAWLMTD